MTAVSNFRAARARRMAWWYFTEYRLLAMSKWVISILLFGLVTPLLYVFAIGLGVGSLVDANTSGVDGVDYLTFLGPALLAAAAIQGAQDETTFPVIQGFAWSKGFFAVNSTPTTGIDIANGVMAVAAIRVFVTTGLYAAVLVVLGAIELDRILPIYLVVCLAALCYGSVIMAASSFVTENGHFIEIINRLVIFPMFMFSGTFFPLENLPIYLQIFGWLSPLWHSSDLARALSYAGDTPAWLIAVHIGYLVLWAWFGLSLAYRKFTARLAK